jgi:hypothetical protein
MKRKFIDCALLFLGLILVTSLSACGCESESVQRGPAVQWYKTFGEGTDTYGSSVQQTTDGGYIVCGWSSDAESNHVLLFKLAPEQ